MDKKRLNEIKRYFLNELSKELDEIFDYYKQELNRDMELFFKNNIKNKNMVTISLPEVEFLFTDEELEEFWPRNG
jgi:hypothetical protein